MRQPPVAELCDGAAHQTAPPYESDECWRNTTCSCEPSARIHADRDRDRDGADAKVQLGPYQGQQPRQVPLNDARIETSGKQAIVHPEHGLNGCLASARNALRSTDANTHANVSGIGPSHATPPSLHQGRPQPTYRLANIAVARIPYFQVSIFSTNGKRVSVGGKGQGHDRGRSQLQKPVQTPQREGGNTNHRQQVAQPSDRPFSAINYPPRIL